MDRGLCNAVWKFRFEWATVTHLPKTNSDHTPLLIDLEGDKHTLPRFDFKFQAAWLTHPAIKEVVGSFWKSHDPLGENIKAVAAGLSDWNKDCFGTSLK